MSSNCDEFDVPSNLYNSRYWRSFEFQPYVIVALEGKLRDREFHRTVYETTRALSRLASRLWMMNCLVRVDSWNQSYIFDNPKWLLDRELSDWAKKLVWEFEDDEVVKLHIPDSESQVHGVFEPPRRR